MLVGYMRVSKADGSQTTDLQRDALIEVGVVSESYMYEDLASGRKDDRPGLLACLKSLREHYCNAAPLGWHRQSAYIGNMTDKHPSRL